MVQKQIANSTDQPLEVRHLSHDLRGPLNSILGFSDLLLEGVEGPLTEIQQEDIAAIRHSARNLLRLINTIVDLSKLEANVLNVELSEVSLDEILTKVLAFQFDGGQAVNIAANMPAPLPQLWGNTERIVEILVILIDFLIKKQRKGQIALTLGRDADRATLQITAEEVFIAAEEAEELFDLSVKVDPNGRSKMSSGGVELPLARQLARLQKGEVRVESEPESGTTLYLSLPIHPSD